MLLSNALLNKIGFLDGKISKTISLKDNDYELVINDKWVGEVPVDIPAPYVAMYRTDGRALDAQG